MKYNELVGRGNAAEVYRYDDKRIIKIFFEDYPKEKIEKEYDQAKFAYESGIPTAAVYDMLETDGRWAIVYDHLKGKVLNRLFSEAVKSGDQKRAKELVTMHADIMKKSHALSMDTGLFAPKDREIKSDVEKIFTSRGLNDEEKDGIISFVSSIPQSDHFIHGDFNLANVILTDDGVRLIDMGGCGTGDPLYDIVSEGTAYVELKDILRIPGMEDTVQKRTEMKYDDVLFFWNELKKDYYEGSADDPSTGDGKRIRALSALRVLMGLLMIPGLDKDMTDGIKRILLPYIIG